MHSQEQNAAKRRKSERNDCSEFKMKGSKKTKRNKLIIDFKLTNDTVYQLIIDFTCHLTIH